MEGAPREGRDDRVDEWVDAGLGNVGVMPGRSADCKETQCLLPGDKARLDRHHGALPSTVALENGAQRNAQGQGFGGLGPEQAPLPDRPSDTCRTSNFCSLFTFLRDWRG